jgi:formate C-acetyltransferase
MFEAIRTYGPPRLTLERAVYFTESFKATEGQLLVLRWAKALKNIAEKMSVAIFDDELIVGRPNTWFGRYSLVFPELDGTIMKAGAEAFIAAKGAPDAVVVTEEDKKIIDEVLFPCWNGKDFTPNFVKALPPESRAMNFGRDPENVGTKQTFVIINTSPGRQDEDPQQRAVRPEDGRPEDLQDLRRLVECLQDATRERHQALHDPGLHGGFVETQVYRGSTDLPAA